MSKTSRKSEEILKRAEEEFKTLITECVSKSLFDDVARLARIGEELLELRSSVIRSFQTDFANPTASDSGKASGRRTIRKSSAKTKSRRKKKPAGYPRFYRSGTMLVKIGWSRSKGREYEHKSPRSIIDCIVESLAVTARSTNEFTIDALFPLTNPDTGAEFPSYQVYLCVAWLRSIGRVIQHGRQGYSLGSDFDAETIRRDFKRLQETT